MGLLMTVLAAAALSFSQIGTKQGLAQSTVVSICQDSRGFMWFSTNTGLVRFDGSNMKFYRNDPGDPATISSDIVSKVYHDPLGRLWVCTETGLSAYRYETDDFFSYTLPEGLPAKDVCLVSKDSLLVATLMNVHILNLGTGEFSEPLYPRHFGPQTMTRADGRILIGSQRRCLVEYDISQDKLSQITPSDILPGPVNAIIQRSYSEFWLATEGGGLLLYDLKKGILETIGKGRICSNRVRALCYDSIGRLWVGTREGLDILDERDGSRISIPSTPDSENGLSYKSVKNIIRDNRGGMWIGTYFGGVNIWNPYESKFESHLNITEDNVSGFLSDAPDGTIWVGSNSGEIVSFDPSDGKCGRIVSQDDFGFFDVKAITFRDNSGKVYVGMHGGGIGELNLRTHSARTLVPKREVYAILPWKDGKYFVAALSGLYYFEPDKGIFSKCKDAPVYFRLFTARYDSSSRLWIGGKDGLRVYSVDADANLNDITPEVLKPLRSIICLHETSDGRIWIGSGYGLSSYNPISETLTKVPLESPRGAASAVAITEDSQGRLWISSEDGLFCHTPKTGVTRRYGTEDGLPGERFNYNAVCRRSDGTIWFGGISGLVGFNPSSFTGTPLPQKPRVVGVKVFNEVMLPGKDEIHLKHYQNTVSFEFASMDYTVASPNKFQYKLEGVDKDWTENRDPVSSTYASLRKGRYTLHLRTVTPEGLSVDAESPVRIVIEPAWYETAAARIAMILLLAAAVLYGLRLRLRQRDIAHRLEIQNLKKEQEDSINHLKAVMYTGKEESTPSEDRFIVKVGKAIEDNISNPAFGVQELASLMGMSRANLNIRIKDTTGETPIDLIRKIRFDKACKLLKEETLTMAEIAYRTGFTSPSYFTTSFKKAFGISPKQYAEGK